MFCSCLFYYLEFSIVNLLSKKNQFIFVRHEEHLHGATKVVPVFLAKSEASKKYISQLSHQLVDEALVNGAEERLSRDTIHL